MQIVMQWVLEGTLSWNSEHVRLIADANDSAQLQCCRHSSLMVIEDK